MVDHIRTSWNTLVPYMMHIAALAEKHLQEQVNNRKIILAYS